MKNLPKNTKNPLNNLLIQNDGEVLTRQTLQSLFRTMLEAIIEEGNKAVVMLKIHNLEGFEGILRRFSYSNSDIFAFSQEIKNEKFISVEQNELGDDIEFAIITAERFSVTIVWSELTNAGQTEYQTFVTFNSKDILSAIDYLNALSNNEIQKKLDEIKLDRRDNTQFNIVFNKLASVIEGAQKDLLCANIELKDLQKQSDKFSRYARIGKQASTIGHELRNQIGILKIYSKVLNKNIEKTTENKDIKDSFKSASENIDKALDNMIVLLEDLKNYSTSVNLNITQTNIVNLIEDTVDFVNPAFIEKNIKLIFEKPENPVFSNIDEIKIQQVLINLLKNTLEAENNTKTLINLEIIKNTIEINIIDNAGGISEDFKEIIFEPTFTTKAEGTGIGLALSKEIIKAHCGDLVLKETGKNGSTFSIYLPLNQTNS